MCREWTENYLVGALRYSIFPAMRKRLFRRETITLFSIFNLTLRLKISVTAEGNFCKLIVAKPPLPPPNDARRLDKDSLPTAVYRFGIHTFFDLCRLQKCYARIVVVGWSGALLSLLFDMVRPSTTYFKLVPSLRIVRRGKCWMKNEHEPCLGEIKYILHT